MRKILLSVHLMVLLFILVDTYNINHERRQNWRGGQGAKCDSDDDCVCPFICRFGGEDTYKCQITDTRGYDEACGFCNFDIVGQRIGTTTKETVEIVPAKYRMKNRACKEGLKCAPGNDVSFICVNTLDIGAECDSDDRCLSGICRMYGEGANTCQKNDTRKLGESCYNDFACAAGDGNENIFCGSDLNSGKGLCCDDYEKCRTKKFPDRTEL